MKKILLFLFVFSQVLFAQESNDKTIYLDSLGGETTQGNHNYYRIIKDFHLTKDSYRIEEYYASGKLKMEGNSDKKDYVSENGPFISYYENGNKKSIVHYTTNQRDGICTFWYENGSKKLEGIYIKPEDDLDKIQSCLFKINNYWDANNNHKVVDGNGEFSDDSSYENEISKTFSTGNVKNGFKDGIWKGAQTNHDFSFTDSYKNSKFVSGSSIDNNGVEYKYTEIFVSAEPKKGLNDFYKHVMKRFALPETFKGKGKVIIKFMVSKEGTIVDPKIIKSVQPDVDAEALKTIASYKGFSSALFRGIKIDSYYQIPIQFESAE